MYTLVMHTREIQFTVDESPVPQPRQRFGVGVRGGRTVAVPIDDRRTSKRDGISKKERIDGFKNAVRAAALLSRSPFWPSVESGWGFRLLCVLRMPCPKDLPKTRVGNTICVTKPDLDNMVKAVAT